MAQNQTYVSPQYRGTPAQAATYTGPSSPIGSSPVQNTINQVQAGISGSQGGAVNAQGQIVGASGQILGNANPADVNVGGTMRPTDVPTKTETTQPSPKPQSVTSPTDQLNIPNVGDQIPGTSLKYEASDISNLQNSGFGNASGYDATKQKYDQASKMLGQANIPAPQTQAAGQAGASTALNNVPQQGPTTTPAVDTFLDPATNPNIAQATQNLQEFLSPQTTRDDVTNALATLTADKAQLASLNVQLMNIKNVMAGTSDDLRTEIEKVGGFATESQVQALATARNKVLIKQSTLLADQVAAMKDQVATDTTLLQNEKELANTQFSQRMSMLQFQQTNYNNQLNATRESYKWSLDNNPQALYNSLIANPTAAQRFTAIMPGVPLDSIKNAASTKALDIQLKQLDIATKQQALGAGTTSNLPSEVLAQHPESQSILAQTGLSIPAFYVLTGQSSNLPRDAATRRVAFKEAENWANQKGVDISTLASQYKAQNDVLDQNIQRAANTKVYAGEVAGSAEALISAIDQKDLQQGFFGKLLGIGAFKPANLVSLATGKQVNDPLTMKYATQLQAMTNDYAGYLAAARGASRPELTDTEEAAKVVANGLNSGSTQAFKEAVQANEEKVAGVVNNAVNDARQAVWDLFGVGNKFTGGKTNRTNTGGSTFQGITLPH